MSLNESETVRTGQELRRHLEVSGLSTQELTAWLGLSESELDAVLQMDESAHPVTTWLVRDALDQTVREQGRDAGGWSTLTDRNRRKATGWFALQDVPPRP